MPETLSAEDRLAVMDLIADYADRLEGGDIEGYVENFTPDGVLQGNTVTHAGRDALRAFVAQLYASGQDGPGGHRHFLCLPKIEAAEGGCRARTYFFIPGEPAADDVRIRSMGLYSDEIVRFEGRWRFKRRRLQILLKRTEGR